MVLVSPLTVGFWVLCVILFIFVFLFMAPNLIISYLMYVIHLKRGKKEKWTRACSSNTEPQLTMYNQGLAWSDANAACRKELHIVNEGLNLYGEFYDHGTTKTAVFIPGRTEGLRYSYYFAIPFWEKGYNVLCIDQRAHGESDGQYNTVGFEEHKDLIAWINLLQKEHHTETVVLHGVCIGSACALYALVSPQCPRGIRGLVADGMYPTFYESFKNHMIELKKPLHPGLETIDAWMKVHTGHSMRKGPIHVIDQLKTPLLMLHSKEDLYSRPSEAQRLYDKCGSQRKTLHWFPTGKHSQLRYTHTAEYDAAIQRFLDEIEA